MPNPTDPMQHLPHPMSAGSLDRPQPPRFMDNPAAAGGPFGFRHSPADLTRPHTAFSPAGFPPRGTPTSMPNNLPMFPPNAGSFPGMPAALESLLMQYHLYNSANHIREQEERERERERERRDQELRRLASAGGSLEQCFDLQRRLFGGQQPGYPDPNSGAPNPGGLPPPMMHNPSSPNPAALAGMMGFPPGGDANRDLFNERMSQSDALFRLQMAQCPDLSQAATLAALGHLNGPHDGPGGGPPGLGGPPPHSQADSMNPLNFPGAPGVRPMMPGRDQYFNPQRYAPYGAAGPYGAPSPFFNLGGPHAP